MTFSDEDLMAYADGELDDAKRQEIQAAINRDPEIARRVASHQALQDSLRKGFEPVLQEPVPDRLLTAARSESSVSKSNVVPLRGHQGPVRPRPRWIALAASFILGALALQFGGPCSDPIPSLRATDKCWPQAPCAKRYPTNSPPPKRSSRQFKSVSALFPVPDTTAAHSNCGIWVDWPATRREAGSSKYWLAGITPTTRSTDPRPPTCRPRSFRLSADTISGEPLDAKEEASARAQKWQK